MLQQHHFPLQSIMKNLVTLRGHGDSGLAQELSNVAHEVQVLARSLRVLKSSISISTRTQQFIAGCLDFGAVVGRLANCCEASVLHAAAITLCALSSRIYICSFLNCQ